MIEILLQLCSMETIKFYFGNFMIEILLQLCSMETVKFYDRNFIPINFMIEILCWKFYGLNRTM